MESRTLGRDVFAQVEEASRRLKDDALAAADRRDAAMSRLDAVEREYDSVLRRLAEFRLPSLDALVVHSADGPVRPRLIELAARRQRSEEELDARRRRVAEEFARRQRAVDRAEFEANRASDAYEDRRNEVTEYLQTDINYQAMKEACDQAQMRLVKDRERLEEVEADAAEKLPDYRASTLFMYLHERNYGTAGYRYSGIRKSLDRRVARLIDYATLRESYEFLTTVPELMRAELGRREDEVDASVAMMLETVKHAEAKFELDRLQETVNKTRKAMVRCSADRDRSAENLETIEDQLDALRSRENRFYVEAVAEMKTYLETVEHNVLAQQAEQTESFIDDDAVAEIRGLREKIENESVVVADELTRSEAAARIADGLDFLLRRARQNELTSERTFYSKDFDFEEPVRQFEKGVIDRHRLVEIFRDAAQKDPTWAERAYQRGADMANSQATQILIGTAAKAAEPFIREALRRRMR